MVRDPDYVLFLKEVDVKRVQLTYFGMEEMTDKYVGRKDAPHSEKIKPYYLNYNKAITEQECCELLKEDTDALNTAKTITIKALVERYGNMHSKRTFFIEDYKSYLLNCFLEELGK